MNSASERPATTFKAIELFVTSKCTEACDLCNQDPLMKSNQYEMTMDSINKFIFFTKKSNYKFKLITISGGESLLWSNLTEAVRALHLAEITDRININTAANLNLISKKQKDIDFISKKAWRAWFRISNYWFNQPGLRLLRQLAPKKTTVVECRFFEIPPTTIQKIPDIENSVCDGPSFAFYDNKIVWCSNLLTLQRRFNLGDDSPLLEHKTVEICENYADKIVSGDLWGKEEICGGCVSCSNITTTSMPNVNTRIKVSSVSVILIIDGELNTSVLENCLPSTLINKQSDKLEIIFCGQLTDSVVATISEFCIANNLPYKCINTNECMEQSMLREAIISARHEKIFVTHSFIRTSADLVSMVNQRTSSKSCFIPNVQNRHDKHYVVFGCDKKLLLTDVFSSIHHKMEENCFLNLLTENKIVTTRTWHELSQFTDLLSTDVTTIKDHTHLHQIKWTDKGRHPHITNII